MRYLRRYNPQHRDPYWSKKESRERRNRERRRIRPLDSYATRMLWSTFFRRWRDRRLCHGSIEPCMAIDGLLFDFGPDYAGPRSWFLPSTSSLRRKNPIDAELRHLEQLAETDESAQLRYLLHLIRITPTFAKPDILLEGVASGQLDWKFAKQLIETATHGYLDQLEVTQGFDWTVDHLTWLRNRLSEVYHSVGWGRCLCDDGECPICDGQGCEVFFRLDEDTLDLVRYEQERGAGERLKCSGCWNSRTEKYGFPPELDLETGKPT